MKNKERFILYDNNNEFEYTKNKSEINIKFNRVAFIFFIFFIISIIYSIHLIHLGSRNSDDLNKNQIKVFSKLKRADIVDRNDNFLARTVSSIDIGINPVEIIDEEKLLLNLRYIFPNKDYESIKLKFKKKKFFWLQKKISLCDGDLRAEDIQNTLSTFTSECISNAVRRFSKDLEIYICGGGAHNRFLMKNLKANFETISVETTSNLGIEPDWVEAAAFAWMAKQTIRGIKLETIPFTGARKSCILGGIYHGG